MFKIDKTPAYWWPVKFQAPAGGDEAGALAEYEFEVQFVRVGVEAFEALNREIMSKQLKDRDVVPRIVRDWRKVEDGGASLPFTPQNLGHALDVPGAAAAIVKAFWDSRSPAAEKN